MKKNLRSAFFLPLLCAASVAMAASAPSTGKSSVGAYQAYVRALLLEAQGNFLAAREDIQQAIQQAPDVAYLYRTSAELSLRLGQVNQASDEIEKAIALDPSDVKSLILGGQINWALGDSAKAEAKLKRAVQLAPDEAEAIVSLAGTLTPKNPQEAVNLYKSYLQRHPTDVDIWERLAQLYQGTGDTASAEKAWKKTLEWEPKSVRAHLALAQLAEVNHDTATAIAHYETVMADDPSNLPLLLRVGELRYRNNEMAKAYEAFSKAKALAPDSAAANFWMALLAEHRGDWNEAIQLLEKVAKGEPDAGVYLRLSYYYSQVGRYADAVKVLEKLVAFQPGNTDFLNYLALAYEQNNQLPDAEKTLKKVLEIDTASPEPHFQLATLYDRMGKWDQAEKELKTAIQIKPDFAVALNYLGYTYADRGIKLDEAEALLNDAVGLEPDNPAYLDSLGWLYYKQGKLQKATDFLMEATRRTRDSLIFDHLADVQNAKGDVVAAYLAWDESLRVDPTAKGIASKMAKALKRMPPTRKVEAFLKRAMTRYGDIRGVNSLIEISLCDSSPCFKSKAQFGVVTNETMRVEIPGPLTGPVMLLTKQKGQPAKYGAVHPQFQTAAPYATRAFTRIEALLSADALRSLDLAELQKSVTQKGRTLTAEGAGARLTFDARTGLLRKIEWTAGEQPDSLEITGDAAPLPSDLVWKDGKSSITLGVEFIKPVVSLFTDAPPVSDKKAD